MEGNDGEHGGRGAEQGGKHVGFHQVYRQQADEKAQHSQNNRVKADDRSIAHIHQQAGEHAEAQAYFFIFQNSDGHRGGDEQKGPHSQQAGHQVGKLLKDKQ